MMNLKEKLTVPHGNKTTNEYFQSLRCIVDDLALINAPIIEDDFVIYALNGIGLEFKEIAAGVKARETEISFEELLNKILDYESMLKKLKRQLCPLFLQPMLQPEIVMFKTKTRGTRTIKIPLATIRSILRITGWCVNFVKSLETRLNSAGK